MIVLMNTAHIKNLMSNTPCMHVKTNTAITFPPKDMNTSNHFAHVYQQSTPPFEGSFRDDRDNKVNGHYKIFSEFQ